MTERTLELEMLGYWHPGTGRGDGVTADAVVHRDATGLPVLPGRTVKGLLRAAAHLGAGAGVFDQSDVERLFGTALPEVTSDDRVKRLEGEHRFGTREARLRVGSACLGRSPADRAVWAAWAGTSEGAGLIPTLVERLASTAIDESSGVAKTGTLRTIEVFVPVTLYAPVQGPDDTPWSKLDECVRLFLRGVGSHRNRGLGRCAARLSPAGGVR